MVNGRSVVIIDGSNLYFKLKSLGLKKSVKFNYNSWVKGLTQGTTLTGQQAFVTQLIKAGFIIQYGYLLKSANGQFY